MPSEKSRYFLNKSPHQDEVRSSGVRNTLQNKIDTLTEAELREQLLRLIAKDEYNLYLGIAAMLPLDALTVDMLLKAVCEQFTQNTGGYTSLDEERLCNLAYELIDRSDHLVKTGSVLPAAETLMVILVNLEPQMEFVEDEGWDLQRVIEECFKSLDFIGDGEYDSSTCKGLKELTDRYKWLWEAGLSLYDKEWKQLSDRFEKMTLGDS
jgi:hypothetical protein